MTRKLIEGNIIHLKMVSLELYAKSIIGLSIEILSEDEKKVIELFCSFWLGKSSIGVEQTTIIKEMLH
jgi:hypothetical protein